MHRFYFNECLPEGISQPIFIDRLSSTLHHFNNLLEQNIDIEPAIVTHQLPSACTYDYEGNEYSLLNVIEQLHNDELRKFAFFVFNRYPIGSYFDDTDESLIAEDWIITVDGEELNAINLAIVGLNEGIAFSVPLARELENNPLSIRDIISERTKNVWNLFGEQNNTNKLAKILIGINVAKLATLDQLKALLVDSVLSMQFERDFSFLTSAEQQSVIDDFQHAIDRQLITRFYPDLRNVKDVTPQKNKCSVYELRVYRPSAIRIYFNESGAKVYLASIGYKNQQNQDAEILAAHNTLYKMIITNK
jgi:putative component of toxin-antitoxin plasmid stabilization module